MFNDNRLVCAPVLLTGVDCDSTRWRGSGVAVGRRQALVPLRRTLLVPLPRFLCFLCFRTVLNLFKMHLHSRKDWRLTILKEHQAMILVQLHPQHTSRTHILTVQTFRHSMMDDRSRRLCPFGRRDSTQKQGDSKVRHDFGWFIRGDWRSQQRSRAACLSLPLGTPEMQLALGNLLLRIHRNLCN